MKPAKTWLKRLWSQDRRKAERYGAPWLVAYYWDGAAASPHMIDNISVAGLYLLTEKRWYPGTLVMMTVQRTGDTANVHSERSIAVQSKVIRSGTDGVGLAFVFPEPEKSRRAQALSSTADQKTFSEFLCRFQ
jgi:hypothetical protein